MRLICGPDGFDLAVPNDALPVVLYSHSKLKGQASAGSTAKEKIRRRKLHAAQRAWDLLSIALSVVTADFAGQRDQSPDGWTREFEIDIAVADPTFWNTQTSALSDALAFLTTDRWQLRFHPGGFIPPPPQRPVQPAQDCVVLLSGGLDSLIGAIDLTTTGKKPFAISQTVRGDAKKQIEFAARVGGGLNHLQLNHNADVPENAEDSQRARSLIFITFGVLAATTLKRYAIGETIPLYVSENGFIALNPPLTGGRIGSLSTRTAHPEFLGRLQEVLHAAGLRISITNPYVAKTKGEMLRDCLDQSLLKSEAAISTSCGRYLHFSYRHCGRCVPCQVRRAAFLAWGEADTTTYVYEDLGKKDKYHAGFDDVRSVAMALATVESEGLESWLGGAVSSHMIDDRAALKEMIGRGLEELKALHRAYNVK
jgi:7-cyano-7-deazaguanine synthase in queuosine biosynthesis